MKKWIGLGCTLSLVTACASVTPTFTDPSPATAVTLPALAPLTVDQPLTLKRIMANPDWMGNAPQDPSWALDGSGLFYWQKQAGSELSVPFFVDTQGHTEALAYPQWHRAEHKRLSEDGRLAAWLYEGNLMVMDLADGSPRQLTRDSSALDDFSFTLDNQLLIRRGNKLFRIDPSSGLTRLHSELVFGQKPDATKVPDSYLAQQQKRLIRYVDKQYLDAADKAQRQQQRQQADPTLAPRPFYLNGSEKLVTLSPSPQGRYLLAVVTDKDGSWRKDHDIMPNYLDKRGYVEAVKARARVAEAEVASQRLVILDTDTGQHTDVSWEGLPGFDADVLAEVKRENAARNGEKYQSTKALRTLRLMQDWGWEQSAIQWSPDGSKLAVMVEAGADNKDRWLATVDLQRGTLTSQHRLHDDAWVNYTHNEFGWSRDGESLYYLSEESGYSQLYLKPLNGKARALTQGQYVVSNLTQSRDGSQFLFKANANHPGQYEVFSVATASGDIQQLTDLKGGLDYRLSPDESQLLLSASSRTRPPELFIQPIGGQARQLTHTSSDAFLDYAWQTPEVVAIPSSHQDKPVYARIYRPQNDSKKRQGRYPAVIFNHGAGYLQNAHYGWSGYFREFMFHNLLAQQGYVVMDIDYRGSKGYGRDWRTAIYRNMGHSEVEDMLDGVNWMAQALQVDEQRVGTYGGSYGGFLTFMALFTQPQAFQAGAALRPVTDWAHYNYGYTSNILNTPQVDPIAYERSSPIEFAQGLEKPLLIMTGVLDDNVFFQDSVRLVQRLIELEKPTFETAIYPVEPHGFRQPSSWLDEYRRIFELFEENLNP
ncbi:prolyl oligopeptidase family serine peptidase [Ferrimonas sp. SCSIO 43195]|uniref:S9 family peptidase n=1 Tax=Ferrimonas sp. SCSIO 43195 TaxID=2822844 RepID=UPI0020763D31|nr:prolyl oligopeptidase family serine peptidase [Ferrimonas sp. SCSIO 43195]USD37908.1 S9 family peptidase [Ferrimonas sp. SCSIO 43195]